ncbi:baseplate J/gp47 family protein [Actinoplanes sp. CA-030573]|uniref:sialidase family protein n=1 Tax=Actinoplanes sp. CA-030573 TaxID=3239898 RepID=UPI003D93A15A
MGNVGAGALTEMPEPIAGVRVSNAAAAAGGRDAESLGEALARRRYEAARERRAITGRDFEVLALAGSVAVGRAGAFTGAVAWPLGHDDEVVVLLVPAVGAHGRPGWRVPMETLVEREDARVRGDVQRLLDGRRPLSTSVVTGWARYKPVSVRGRVVVPAEEDPEAVRGRLVERLNQVISPLPAAGRNDGWPFGEPLRASDVTAVVEQCAPEKSRLEELRFVVRDAPDGQIRAVGVDPSRGDVWYSGAGEVLFRSVNGGSGWEAVGRFPGEDVRRVIGNGARPGTLAVVTRTAEGPSRLYLSSDFGESWARLAELEPVVTGAAWVAREGDATLLLSTDSGLYEVAPVPGAIPLQVMVDQADVDRGFAAVSSFVTAGGVPGVAIAAQANLGVYLSTDAGRTGTFTGIGLAGADVRALAVRVDGEAAVLWAGLGESDPNKPGRGCQRARLLEGAVRWEQVNSGWTGGTCWDLAFDGTAVLAATQSAGVSRLDGGGSGPSWKPANVNGGLPLRDRTRFQPVTALAVAAGGRALAGTNSGVYLRTGSDQWAAIANRETHESVTIPPTWLLCSDEHDIEVVRETA